MLMHYVSTTAIIAESWRNYANNLLQIEEVKGVNQVLDEEEQIAMKEFAKFEEKLRQQKGPGATTSSALDTAE